VDAVKRPSKTTLSS